MVIIRAQQTFSYHMPHASTGKTDYYHKIIMNGNKRNFDIIAEGNLESNTFPRDVGKRQKNLPTTNDTFQTTQVKYLFLPHHVDMLRSLYNRSSKVERNDEKIHEEGALDNADEIWDLIQLFVSKQKDLQESRDNSFYLNNTFEEAKNITFSNEKIVYLPLSNDSNTKLADGINTSPSNYSRFSTIDECDEKISFNRCWSFITNFISKKSSNETETTKRKASPFQKLLTCVTMYLNDLNLQLKEKSKEANEKHAKHLQRLLLREDSKSEQKEDMSSESVVNSTNNELFYAILEEYSIVIDELKTKITLWELLLSTLKSYLNV